MTSAGARPLRADAARNRGNILEAARQQITAHGPTVGMDQIAVAAGVAVGTLYRHFPTKTDLVAAVVSEFVAGVADEAESAVRRVEEGRDAFAELAGLLRVIVEATADNRAAKAAAAGLATDVSNSQDALRAAAAVRRLVEVAQRDRTVRSDLTADDFYLMVSNVPADQPPAVLQRWVDLMLFGIAGPTKPRKTQAAGRVGR